MDEQKMIPPTYSSDDESQEISQIFINLQNQCKDCLNILEFCFDVFIKTKKKKIFDHIFMLCTNVKKLIRKKTFTIIVDELFSLFNIFRVLIPFKKKPDFIALVL